MKPETIAIRFREIIETIRAQPSHRRRYPLKLKQAVSKSLNGGFAPDEIANAIGVPATTVMGWRGAGPKKHSVFVELPQIPSADDEPLEDPVEETSDDECAESVDDDHREIVIETSGGCRIFIPV